MRAIVVVALMALASPSFAQEPMLTKGDVAVLGEDLVGCTWEVFKESERLAPDRIAHRKAITLALAGGQCVMMRKGSTVVVERNAMFSNAIEVREKGEITQWWVVSGILLSSARKTGSLY